MNLLNKPILTEKSMFDASRGVYTFLVDRRADKHQLKELVEELFKVQVIKITTHKRKLAVRTTGRRRLKTPSSPVKYARIFLKKGQSIALFDLKDLPAQAGDK